MKYVIGFVLSSILSCIVACSSPPAPTNLPVVPLLAREADCTIVFYETSKSISEFNAHNLSEAPIVHPATQNPTRKARAARIAILIGSAFFDAASTRMALSSGRAFELNPLMRFAAGGAGLYIAVPATVIPLVVEAVRAKKTRGRARTVQAVTALHIVLGIHNLLE